MRVSFQVPSKSVEDKDKTRSIVHGLVYFVEHTKDNAVYGMEKAVKEGAAF